MESSHLVEATAVAVPTASRSSCTAPWSTAMDPMAAHRVPGKALGAALATVVVQPLGRTVSKSTETCRLRQTWTLHGVAEAVVEAIGEGDTATADEGALLATKKPRQHSEGSELGRTRN